MCADGIFTFNESIVMATTPIIVSENSREAIAAVAGLQMRYDKFYEYFFNISRVCPSYEPDCNLTCATEVCIDREQP